MTPWMTRKRYARKERERRTISKTQETNSETNKKYQKE
jgi:hypothetical protein